MNEQDRLSEQTLDDLIARTESIIAELGGSDVRHLRYIYRMAIVALEDYRAQENGGNGPTRSD